MFKQFNNLPEKTIPDNTDILPIQQADGITRHITRENFLSGTGGSSNSEYPGSFSHWHDESIVTVGAALVPDYSTNNPYGVTNYQPSNAIGDSFTFDVFLEAGNYELHFLGHNFTNRGKAGVTVNGVSVNPDLDFYGGNTIINQIRNVAVSTSGKVTFVVTVSGKHPASSAYYITLTKVWGIKLL